MENITIEKMEIKRFNALLMRTIVGMLFMGVLMWETFCLDTGRKGFFGRDMVYICICSFAVCRCSDKSFRYFGENKER